NEAMLVLTSAYRDINTDPAIANLLNNGNNGANGPPPAFLQSRLSNFQAGLARLQGGGGAGASGLGGLF
ncbi:MAG: hypothetical protein AAF869_09115, partial [Pseudomonadota bacterium]